MLQSISPAQVSLLRGSFHPTHHTHTTNSVTTMHAVVVAAQHTYHGRHAKPLRRPSKGPPFCSAGLQHAVFWGPGHPQGIQDTTAWPNSTDQLVYEHVHSGAALAGQRSCQCLRTALSPAAHRRANEYYCFPLEFVETGNGSTGKPCPRRICVRRFQRNARSQKQDKLTIYLSCLS